MRFAEKVFYLLSLILIGIMVYGIVDYYSACEKENVLCISHCVPGYKTMHCTCIPTDKLQEADYMARVCKDTGEEKKFLGIFRM